MLRRIAPAHLCVLLLCAQGILPGWGADKPKPAPAKVEKVGHPWDRQPTFEELYERYLPSFADTGQRGENKAPKYSKQPNFLNLGEVDMDAQVWPIIKKANELAWAKKEPRRATELYRQILENFPSDLCQIAEEGVFIPASLYVQRQILRYPPKELNYYRILFDPPAKEIFGRAVRRYSIPDYKDLVKFHLATSYGDDALFALGNSALDNGRFNEARRYYEQIVTYHGLADDDKDEITLDRDQVWVRLAICYKHLNQDGEFQAVLAKIRNTSEPTVANLLKQLAAFKYDEYETRQRESRLSPAYDALDDRSISQPMPYPWPANRGQWEAKLASRQWFFEPEARPWVTETDLIYKDHNVVYSRSLLTGELNWAFGPGGASQDWDYYGPHNPPFTNWYPEQSMLIHEGVVFSHMFVYGPSLVAIDQFTGRQLWAKGPMAATDEDEWLDRYQAAASPGRGSIIAPVVHDDIRGRTHVSSTAELAAFQPRTGKLLWRTRLARLAPLKLTQSRYPRKLRIFSSRPLVSQGVVYHVTNAGVIAALDEQTGETRWMTRYPQNEKALDNFSDPGKAWRNEPPLIRGNKLYCNPVDSGHLLCLDTETGRVLWAASQGAESPAGNPPSGRVSGFSHAWRVAGFSPEGELCVSGMDLTFLDPENGKLKWRAGLDAGSWLGHGQFYGGSLSRTKNPLPKGVEPAIDGEGNDFWVSPGHIEVAPRFTKSGEAYIATRNFNGNNGGAYNVDWKMDLKTHAITAQRRWFSEGWMVDGGHNPPLGKRPVNEEPEPLRMVARMAVTRWGVPFEIDVFTDQIVVRFDREKLNGILAKQNDLDSLFAKAEMARSAGDVMGAIRIYETCKPLLPSEEEDRRRNINLRLFPLYMEVARWGHQAGDLGQLETACRNMGATASNPEQEIRALLAYSEYHEKKGDQMAAARVLQNASRHYWREPVRVSDLEVGERKELLALAQKGLDRIFAEAPAPYADFGGKQVKDAEYGALEDYFLSVANVDLPQVVEARNLIALRLRALLGRGSPSFKEEYEAQAAKELNQYQDPEIGERLLWCWPEANGSKKKVGELLSKESKGAQTEVEKQGLKWRYDDLARACGLGEGLVPGGRSGLAVPERPSLGSASGYQEVETKNEDPEMVRLVLPQRGELAAAPQYLFVGGRKKRAYGNRFTVLCWDMKADKKVWESAEILLRGQTDGEEAYEVGFEEVFLQGEQAIVHGRFDVVALKWEEGKDLRKDGKKEKAWHYRVPLGFEIQAVGQCGEVLILCGRRSTLALSTKTSQPTGEVIWEVTEVGEYYAGPFFQGDEMLTVRKSPSEVSFRRLGTGRMLSRLSIAGLTTNRKHPIFAGESGEQSPAAAEAVEAYPVAFGEGSLVVVDGRSFHTIDVAKRKVRWSRPADKLDPSVDAAYRMWIEGGRIFILKPYYSVLENLVLDLATGDMLWRRREGGQKVDAKLKNFQEKDAGSGKAATGLVFNSMTFVDGNVYGVKYEMNASNVTLVGMDPKTGNHVMEVGEKGYSAPEAYVEPSLSKDCVVVRIQDGNNFELWQVNVKEKKVVQKLKLGGYGRLGEYGDASMGWQGPHLALWTYEKRKTNKP